MIMVEYARNDSIDELPHTRISYCRAVALFLQILILDTKMIIICDH